ncbi:large subunit ribosomal protein L17 [Spirosoma oryzae]|uniref:Large ribosomal subunit protein bL17 n=1 Tax=Spirosoma oryzae TaxID=1469603 RepID=A0A2T0T5I6_9BACT|nr:50S ribosomal protein L17 [Spirosoma oryzae]PRY40926.1 large subunit ribosomal protein L17 [Spirosoma oryzae]
MRHGKKDNHLSRTHSHREAMLQNMASSLIMHKRIETTVAKAKELRKFVEPILTRAKDDNNQNRKVVFQTLANKETIKELFGAVADKIANRPGGYTRIIKLGNRQGDNAETCLIELVDFNELLLGAAAEKATATTRTRRSRRSGGSKAEGAEVAPAPAETLPADAEVAETSSAAGDDLTIIEGIGPKIAELLKNAGITTFAQLADANDEAVQQVLTEAGPSFNVHDAGSWNEQAALARDGKMDELKEMQDRLKGGKE